MEAASDWLTPSAPPPVVAVCIPAHGDPAALARALRSLRWVNHPADRLHVIVAIDGPDHELELVASQLGAIVTVLPANRGSYAARNAALEALPAATEVVLFTDADVLVTPSWVSRHVEALRIADRSAGRIEVTTGWPPTPAEFIDAATHLDQRHYASLGFAATANLGLRRVVADALRFDASRRSGGDFEFGQRATAAGFSIAYADDAVVIHPARRTAVALLRKTDRIARGAAQLQADGYPASDRRAGRTPIRDRATARYPDASRSWKAQLVALDVARRLVYAARVPGVVGPAVRRRVWGAAS